MLSSQYIVSYGHHNVYLSKDVTLARYKSSEARRMLSFQYSVSYGRHNVYLTNANVTSLVR
jgi:uncharacterized protein YgiM (DUF1202 family)